jgi:hypothetical protein
MPAIEHLCKVESLSAESMALPIAEASERSKRARCAFRDRSRICQLTNADCPGSRKGN